MAAGKLSPFSAIWLVEKINRGYVERSVQQYGGGWTLDLGCGLRPYEESLSRANATPVGLEYNRQRYADSPPDIWGDGLSLPFESSSFDTVLSSQVLEHVPEPGQFVAEISRVLKPGGRLILTAPHIWGIHEEPHDYFRFTPFGLAHLARKSGLEPIEIVPMAGYWVTAGARFCHYLQQFERLGLAILLRPSYAVLQLLVWALDRLHRVESDAWNYLMVAQKQ